MEKIEIDKKIEGRKIGLKNFSQKMVKNWNRG